MPSSSCSIYYVAQLDIILSFTKLLTYSVCYKFTNVVFYLVLDLLNSTHSYFKYELPVPTLKNICFALCCFEIFKLLPLSKRSNNFLRILVFLILSEFGKYLKVLRFILGKSLLIHVPTFPMRL